MNDIFVIILFVSLILLISFCGGAIAGTFIWDLLWKKYDLDKLEAANIIPMKNKK